MYTDTGFESSVWKGPSGELDTKAWMLRERSNVDLSILYQEVRVNKISKVVTAEKRSVWACGILKAMGRAVRPTF